MCRSADLSVLSAAKVRHRPLSQNVRGIIDFATIWWMWRKRLLACAKSERPRIIAEGKCPPCVLLQSHQRTIDKEQPALVSLTAVPETRSPIVVLSAVFWLVVWLVS